MRLAHPYYLLLLLIIPGLIWWSLKGQKRRRGSLIYSDLGLVHRAPTSRSPALYRLPLALRVLAIFLFVLALARPQAGRHGQEILTEGIDILLCLDVSGSMKAEDFKPKNRLHVAKEAAAQFISGRANDRMGMVVFAGKSFTQCPLTLDQGILLDFLDRIQIGMIEDGTAIGMALGTGINRLRDSTAKSKVIILLTDGINNRGEIDPITAARMAAALDIKIYTIGAGTRGQAPYPVEDPIFGRRYVQMPVEIDEETLMEIAGITGGKYFRATDGQKLSQIYAQIDQMEKTLVKTKEYVEYSERFHLALMPAFLLLMAEVVLAHTRFRKIP
jgi:Ca-activated chloride channel family protein